MPTFIILLLVIPFAGCATAFKGYTSSVDLAGVSESTQITTLEGVPVPVQTGYEQVKKYNPMTGDYRYQADSTRARRFVQLRSNHDYVLIVKNGQSESRIEVYPKINLWWSLLDLVCGGFPVIIDGVSGNWNYFDTIALKK